MVVLVVALLAEVTVVAAVGTVEVGVGVVGLDTVMGSQFEFIGSFISNVRGINSMGAL